VACHGDKGQGTVGPNITDEYWLHGGKVTSIFKTIKYGVPEKGMISWEKTLTAKQISDVSNYIISLKGTNPANGKTPQGDKEG
jgi:cytochrome c oxidase cbb3-type subunit 3